LIELPPSRMIRNQFKMLTVSKLIEYLTIREVPVTAETKKIMKEKIIDGQKMLSLSVTQLTAIGFPQEVAERIIVLLPYI